MRRILPMLVLCLMLCGCAAEEPADAHTLSAMEETIPVAEPTGCLETDSTMEAQTGGAVRRYLPQIADCYAIAPLGESVALFSGEDLTTVTVLSGDGLYLAGQIELEQYIHPEDPAVQVTQRGISYFHEATGEVVLLDTELKEVARIALPGAPIGTPLLSADRKSVYYCTENGVRVLELESGISRMLLEVGYPMQTVENLLLEETVLQCRMTDENGTDSLLFLDVTDGTLLYETRENIRVSTWEKRYYAYAPEGAMTALLFGSADSAETQMLLPRNVTADAWFLEAQNGVVTASAEDDGTTLEYYSLTDGHRLSILTLEGESLLDVSPADSEKGVYLLCTGENGESVIYHWDAEALPCVDEEDYVCPRYTLESPDTEGLEACQAYADALGKLYGVRILLGSAATQAVPSDYKLETEYQVPMIRQALERLSHWLAAYPERFLSQGADNTASGIIRIALVRSITPAPTTGSMDSDLGVHYWIGEEPYIALAVGRFTEQTVYHQLYHGMESKLFADSQVYYEWDNLNPESFSYDYSYTQWESRTESEYLTGENRAFIDSFSMTFPMEDRARIMEYAMTPDHEAYFQSETMQTKLYQLCLGIRKAFGLTKSEDVYLWEQYLQNHLAYVPKK